MGLILLIVAICFVIGIIAASEYKAIEHRVDVFIKYAGVSGLIGLAFLCIILYTSYYNTVDMKERLVNIDVYVYSIETYTKRATAVAGSGELTDMKYQNYQKQIGEMIVDLRKEIVAYNSDYIGKIAYGRSWFWNWVIFSPPNFSRAMDMSDYIN